MIVECEPFDYPKESYSGSNNRGMSADKRLSYCEKCEEVWELVRGEVKKYNIPSYGKKHKICPKCSGNLPDKNESRKRGGRRAVDKETANRIREDYKNQNISYAYLIEKYDISR